MFQLGLMYHLIIKCPDPKSTTKLAGSRLCRASASNILFDLYQQLDTMEVEEISPVKMEADEELGLEPDAESEMETSANIYLAVFNSLCERSLKQRLLNVSEEDFHQADLNYTSSAIHARPAYEYRSHPPNLLDTNPS
jgi:hypothetical protein